MEINNPNRSTELQKEMEDIYCKDLSIQYMHIPDVEKQNFLSELVENPPILSSDDKVDMAKVFIYYVILTLTPYSR